MIYDCFTFCEELDLLEIRLHVLDKVVDKFVLVEGNRTFTGTEKPFYYLENKERFKAFEDRIIPIAVEDFPLESNPWAKENHQRNCIIRGLSGCKEDDILVISNVDEIPKPEVLRSFKGNEITGIEMDLFNYYLNLMRVDDYFYVGAKICRYKNIKEKLNRGQFVYNERNLKKYNQGTTINKIYNSTPKEIIFDGGWHFTFMGDAAAIKKKLSRYPRQELNSYQNFSEKSIENNLLVGKGIFGLGRIAQVPLKENLPAYISDNKSKFAHLILEGPLNFTQEKRHRKKINYGLKYLKQTIINLFYPLKWADNLNCKYR